MSSKKDGNFFSTEEEFNQKSAAQENGEEVEFDYGKYLVDFDDGEEIINREYDEFELPEENDKIEKKPQKGKKNKKRKKQLAIAYLCIFLAIVIALGGAGYGYWKHINKEGVFGDSGEEYNNNQSLEAEKPNEGADMYPLEDADSLNECLYDWAHNGGDKMSNANVLNVLLCGVDTSDGVGRSDSMILVSVNKNTKTVTLSSFFRDSYIYMDIPLEGGGYSGRYEKINASYALGGPATLIDTLEKNYKIEIDQYIQVDFASFKGIINAIGGVDVEVEEREAMYIRRTSKHTSFPYGKSCHLNGAEALVYSRIRYLDSDVNRTERQRKVIKSLISKSKGATKGQLLNAYKSVVKYLRTGYTQDEVLSLIGTAVVQDWMDYEIKELTLPEEDGVDMRSSMVYTTSSPSAQQWVWIVDYPVCAQKLQKAIYGETNIVLSSDRVSALDLLSANKITVSDYISSNTTVAYVAPSTTAGVYSYQSTTAAYGGEFTTPADNPGQGGEIVTPDVPSDTPATPDDSGQADAGTQ